MRPHRKVVKDWLRTVDREELNAVIDTAIFTPDELKYIHMRLIEGKSFKQIANCAAYHGGIWRLLQTG